MDKILDKANLIVNENERLIANILHDIKSPLCGVKIALQANLKGEFDKELKKDIYDTILEVLRYIENFLVDYSFKTGKFENKTSLVNVKDIITNKLEINKYLFIDKNIFIDLILDEDDYTLNSINIFLSSVIGNIITNMAVHGSKNQRATIELIRKKDYIETNFKNYYNGFDTKGFDLGLDMAKKLSNVLKIDFKFTKTKDCAIVNLKIPNLA